MDARDEILRSITEAEYQATVIAFAEANGWLVVHQLISRGTRSGWPDLVLIRGTEMLLVELKSETGRVSPAQFAMLATLRALETIDVMLARPSDQDALFARLTGKP